MLVALLLLVLHCWDHHSVVAGPSLVGCRFRVLPSSGKIRRKGYMYLGWVGPGMFNFPNGLNEGTYILILFNGFRSQPSRLLQENSIKLTEEP